MNHTFLQLLISKAAAVAVAATIEKKRSREPYQKKDCFDLNESNQREMRERETQMMILLMMLSNCSQPQHPIISASGVGWIEMDD